MPVPNSLEAGRGGETASEDLDRLGLDFQAWQAVPSLAARETWSRSGQLPSSARQQAMNLPAAMEAIEGASASIAVLAVFLNR